MTVTEYQNYMEAIATKVKAISHTPEKPRFARSDAETAELVRPALDMNYPVLLLEELSGALRGDSLDNIRDFEVFAFSIHQTFQNGDFDGRTAALHNCKEVGRQILAQMRKDKEDQYQGVNPERNMMGFEIDSVEYEEVEPRFDNAVGYLFQFINHSGFDLEYDASLYN